MNIAGPKTDAPSVRRERPPRPPHRRRRAVLVLEEVSVTFIPADRRAALAAALAATSSCFASGLTR
jgi:hypothetical protein